MCENIMEEEAEGFLISEKYDIKIPANVQVDQSIKGNLKGIFKIQKHDKDLGELSNETGHFLKFKFEGKTSNEKNLKMDGLVIADYEIKTKSGEFRPREVKIEPSSPPEKSHCDTYLKIGLTNFRIPGHECEIETEIGTIRFKKTEFYKEAIKQIKNSKEAHITSYAYLDNPNLEDSLVSEYFSESEKVIDRISDLWSFAQGSYQCRTHEEIFDCNDELIWGKYISPKTKEIAFNKVIPYFDLEKYLHETYEKYRELDKDLDLSLIIEWYIDSLTKTTIEPKFINGFIPLEALAYRFSKTNNQENIIKDEDKFKEFSKKIRCEAKRILKKMDFEENEEDIYDEIPNKFKNEYTLNTYFPSFQEKLSFLLEEGKIGYKDLFLDLGVMANIRNNIVHQGEPERDYKTIIEKYENMLSLLRRILLSLLEYDEKRFINRKNNSNIIPFSRDPNGEYNEVDS